MGDVGMSLVLGGPRNDIIPSKLIAFWPLAFDKGVHPQLADWFLCDGNNGTPNLIGRYAKGALNDAAVLNTGGNLTHQHAPGTYATPAHTHGPGTFAAAAHTHDFDFAGKYMSCTYPAGCNVAVVRSIQGASAIDGTERTVSTDSDGPHAVAGLSEEKAASGITGSSDSENHEPPFTEMHYIQKA